MIVSLWLVCTQPTLVLIQQIVGCSFNGTNTNFFSCGVPPSEPGPLRVCPPPYSLLPCHARCLQARQYHSVQSWVALVLVMSSVFHAQCDCRSSWKMYEQVGSSLHSAHSLSILDWWIHEQTTQSICHKHTSVGKGYAHGSYYGCVLYANIGHHYCSAWLSSSWMTVCHCQCCSIAIWLKGSVLNPTQFANSNVN